MNVEEEIKKLRDEIRTRVGKIRWLKKHGATFASLPGGTVWGANSIDFDHLAHKDTVKLIRKLGGKWQKSANAQPGKIDYETEYNGITVRVWGGEPPPSCRMVEVEEDVPEKVIPAHKRKVLKMICSGHGEPLAEAISKVVGK